MREVILPGLTNEAAAGMGNDLPGGGSVKTQMCEADPRTQIG